jgi:CheY-like chemotaxis protein
MVNILLVDDDEVAVMSVQRAFKKGHITNPLYLAGNGIEALDILRGKPGSGSPMPTDRRIILLDLHMPKMDGLTFLKELRSDPAISHIPVIILSSSLEEEDLINAYHLNVSGYMLKSVAFDIFVERMVTLNQYWAFCEMT